MDILSLNELYLNYYIIFNAEIPIEKYSPITHQSITKSYEGAMHGFDADLQNIIPAIRYCLHLPRMGLDTIDLPPKVIDKGYEVPHSIILIPSYALSEVTKSPMMMNYPPTLFISEDNFFETAKKISLENKPLLGHVKLSELSEKTLENHWKVITQVMDKLDSRSEVLSHKPKLVSNNDMSAIPLSFNAKQLNKFDDIFESLKKYEFSKESVYWHTIKLSSSIKTMIHFEEKNNFSPTKEEWTEQEKKQLVKIQAPIVITLTGTAGRHRPSNINANTIERNEKYVVDLLGVHRATARNGYWLDGGYLPKKIFVELNQLETHCKGNNISNRYIWNSMRKIGKILAVHLGEENLRIVHRASHITAFTDFPIGIAILPGYDDPLCCIKPISYRSLTPLTRALQMELPRVGELYIGKRLKVVVAECLLSSDNIRNASNSAWKKAIDMLNANENADVLYSEIKNTKELKKFLKANSDADILVISAHGYYNEKENVAGLWIGEELWFATDEDITVPPIVILSACHVAPRGLGAVTVTDMLHRIGARAILGTLIPVDVFRNGLLTIRLFVYICEALSGRGKMRTLSDAWRWVVGSNAVNEVIASSRNIQKWASGKAYGDHSVIETFGLKRSKGHLRSGFFYTDTINILDEMAKETNYQNEFKALINSQGVFPESCFYVWSGTPENVILTDSVFEKAYNSFGS